MKKRTDFQFSKRKIDFHSAENYGWKKCRILSILSGVLCVQFLNYSFTNNCENLFIIFDTLKVSRKTFEKRKHPLLTPFFFNLILLYCCP